MCFKWPFNETKSFYSRMIAPKHQSFKIAPIKALFQGITVMVGRLISKFKSEQIDPYEKWGDFPE